MTCPAVIDTDPGLDDAVAILFALQSGLFDVLGITTVAGNIGIGKVTRNAGRLLSLLQSQVGVHRGAAHPVERTAKDAVEIHGDDGLGGVMLPEPLAPAGDDAASWLADLLDTEPPGTLDVLALGPLTNIALLLRDFPDSVARIGRIIAMGGAVNEPGNVGPRAEFNMACDPEAAALVFSSNIEIVLIPLDVTRQVRADRAYCKSLMNDGGAASTTAARLISAYFDTTDDDSRPESRPLHDPCVMLYAAAPDLFKLEKMKLDVDVTVGPDAGALGPGNMAIDVAMGVSAPKALDLLRSGLKGAVN